MVLVCLLWVRRLRGPFLRHSAQTSPVVSGAAGAQFSEIPWLCVDSSLGVWGRRWPGAQELGAGGWGACLRLGPGPTVPQNQGFLLSRMVTLGVSFGLVACVLGLVLGLCFAHKFLVSGRPLSGPRPGPAPLALRALLPG